MNTITKKMLVTILKIICILALNMMMGWVLNYIYITVQLENDVLAHWEDLLLTPYQALVLGLTFNIITIPMYYFLKGCTIGLIKGIKDIINTNDSNNILEESEDNKQ